MISSRANIKEIPRSSSRLALLVLLILLVIPALTSHPPWTFKLVQFFPVHDCSLLWLAHGISGHFWTWQALPQHASSQQDPSTLASSLVSDQAIHETTSSDNSSPSKTFPLHSYMSHFIPRFSSFTLCHQHKLSCSHTKHLPSKTSSSPYHWCQRWDFSAYTTEDSRSLVIFPSLMSILPSALFQSLSSNLKSLNLSLSALS